jgi:hypothetical protein
VGKGTEGVWFGGGRHTAGERMGRGPRPYWWATSGRHDPGAAATGGQWFRHAARPRAR